MRAIPKSDKVRIDTLCQRMQRTYGDVVGGETSHYDKLWAGRNFAEFFPRKVGQGVDVRVRLPLDAQVQGGSIYTKMVNPQHRLTHWFRLDGNTDMEAAYSLVRTSYEIMHKP